MKTKLLILTAPLAAMSLTACAENYAVEGAAAGAAVGAAAAATGVVGADVATAAAVGAAVGGAAGYFIDKDDDCDDYDDRGRLDDDCYGLQGYPVDPR